MRGNVLNLGVLDYFKKLGLLRFFPPTLFLNSVDIRSS